LPLFVEAYRKKTVFNSTVVMPLGLNVTAQNLIDSGLVAPAPRLEKVQNIQVKT